jgi:hypothetical protein
MSLRFVRRGKKNIDPRMYPGVPEAFLRKYAWLLPPKPNRRQLGAILKYKRGSGTFFEMAVRLGKGKLLAQRRLSKVSSTAKRLFFQVMTRTARHNPYEPQSDKEVSLLEELYDATVVNKVAKGRGGDLSRYKGPGRAYYINDVGRAAL